MPFPPKILQKQFHGLHHIIFLLGDPSDQVKLSSVFFKTKDISLISCLFSKPAMARFSCYSQFQHPSTKSSATPRLGLLPSPPNQPRSVPALPVNRVTECWIMILNPVRGRPGELPLIDFNLSHRLHQQLSASFSTYLAISSFKIIPVQDIFKNK